MYFVLQRQVLAIKLDLEGAVVCFNGLFQSCGGEAGAVASERIKVGAVELEHGRFVELDCWFGDVEGQ